MRILQLGILATAIATMGLAPLAAARANTITHTFSITVSPAASLMQNDNTFFFSTPFALFDPADGTLNSMSATLTGSGTWTFGGIPGPFLQARLTFGHTKYSDRQRTRL
ncbi:MAG TPA: hypothetical protein VKY65_11615 [Alphaproteobacteria bacterium]|nr:hypothetical protein [Alphaproteobacteria bacterium]